MQFEDSEPAIKNSADCHSEEDENQTKQRKWSVESVVVQLNENARLLHNYTTS